MPYCYFQRIGNMTLTGRYHSHNRLIVKAPDIWESEFRHKGKRPIMTSEQHPGLDHRVEEGFNSEYISVSSFLKRLKVK